MKTPITESLQLLQWLQNHIFIPGAFASREAMIQTFIRMKSLTAPWEICQSVCEKYAPKERIVFNIHPPEGLDVEEYFRINISSASVAIRLGIPFEEPLFNFCVVQSQRVLPEADIMDIATWAVQLAEPWVTYGLSDKGEVRVLSKPERVSWEQVAVYLDRVGPQIQTIITHLQTEPTCLQFTKK